MDFDLQEYMGAYVDGSRENLDTMDKMLLNLEQNPQNLDTIEEIFRAAHTLKGMSATMGFEKVAHLTHDMESILDKLRHQEIAVTAEVIDVIFETFDILRTLVNDSIAQTDSGADLTTITGKLQALGIGTIGASAVAATTVDDSYQSEGAGYAYDEHAAVSSSAPGALAEELGEMDISDFEISGLLDSIQSGEQAFLLKVALVSDCLLKGPRIFMVLRALDNLRCGIVRSVPEVKDLENEKFDLSFKMVVSTRSTSDEIILNIESISEIETVVVIPITSEDLRPGSGPAPVATPSPVPPPPPPPQQAASPAVQPATHSAPTAPAPVAPAPQAAPSPPLPTSVPPGNRSGIEGLQVVDGKPIEGVSLDEEASRETVELVQMVSFRMAGETYALEIQMVESIMNLVTMTRVPKAPSHIQGVINLRGEIVPVINLRKRLKMTETEGMTAKQIIILSFEEEKVKVGFLVDAVQEVLRLPATSIEPPSNVADGVSAEHLRGVGKIEVKIGEKTEHRIIIMLNAYKIVFG